MGRCYELDNGKRNGLNYILVQTDINSENSIASVTTISEIRS